MRIDFFKNEEGTPVKIGELTVSKTIQQNRKGFLSLIDVNAAEFLKDYLAVDRIVSTGIQSIRSCGDFWSTFQVKKGVNKDIIGKTFRETIISGRPDDGGVGEDHIEWDQDPVVTGDGETDLVIGCNVFDTGFIVGSSAKLTNIIGGQEAAYFTKITSKNFKQGSRLDAKVFKDEKALLKYMNDKKWIFSDIAQRTGYEFFYEPVSQFYVQERKKPLSGEVFDQLDAIFSEINHAEQKDPEFAVGGTPQEEALLRMKEMNLWNRIVADFRKSGKIFMSEFGGIIYDLNDDAKTAVEETKAYGYPYHVVRTQSDEIGDMYAVLYVSNHPEEWEYEHRDPKTGLICARVFNASWGCTDAGDIQVEPANGGLMRTA